MCLYVLPCPWMNESQNTGVQTLPLSLEGGFAPPGIYFISQQRVMHIGHMDSDLVCAACLETAFNISVFAETAQNLTVCDGPLAVRANCHSLAVCRISSQRFIDSEFIFGDVVIQYGKIATDNTVLLQLCGYAVVCGVVLTDNDAPCCISVDPMDDARAHNAVDPGQTVAAVIHNCIDKRP